VLRGVAFYGKLSVMRTPVALPPQNERSASCNDDVSNRRSRWRSGFAIKPKLTANEPRHFRPAASARIYCSGQDEPTPLRISPNGSPRLACNLQRNARSEPSEKASGKTGGLLFARKTALAPRSWLCCSRPCTSQAIVACCWSSSLRPSNGCPC